MAIPRHSFQGVTGKLREYAELVKLEHTIFALPFALSAMLLATEPLRWPTPETALWILLAMVGGRTYAMGLNRLIDARIDGENPRTKNRSIPAGRVRKAEAWALTLLAGVLLTYATFQLPLICQMLLPPAFAVLTLYSFVKRFSSLAHLVLGIALGSSAVGGWLAVTGTLSWLPVIFGFAVVFWVAGFDIIYACQDVAFDQSANLKSIPASVGITRAMVISRACHLITIALMTAFGLLYPYTGIGYCLATLLMAGMLVYEHRLIRAEGAEIRLDKINEAFFTVNGQISLTIFALVLMDKLLQ